MAECFESQVVEFRLIRWTLKGYCSFTGDHSGCFEQVGLELEDCMLGAHRIVHPLLSALLWCGPTPERNGNQHKTVSQQELI